MKPGACKYCEARVQDWERDDEPVCAFKLTTWNEVAFRRDNWNCAAMNLLREKAKVTERSGDQIAALLPIRGGGFIALSWCHGSHYVESAAVLTCAGVDDLEIRHVEAFLRELP